MRLSQAFVPTLKEAPKDATAPSHVLLLRAGYVRMVGAGLYEMLPLGLRVQRRIERIVREEMDRAGAQEILMPALLPADYFRESGRWDAFGETLLRLKDRKGGDYHLGPTHEEIVTDLVRREVRSYRQLPLNLYQIQAKYRDEPRPRAGLLRGREFLMKDAYSFDADEAGALRSYEAMKAAYHRIFRRLGLEYRVVEAHSGAMGGSTSAEFQVLAQHGEDALVACGSCDYAANVEVAEAHFAPDVRAASRRGATLERVHTPGVHAVEEVAAFLRDGTRPEHLLKSLLYVADGDVVMAVVRGDRTLSEPKLAQALGVAEVRLASAEEVEAATGAAVGFAGPVGFQGRILVDREVPHVLDAVAGANETDYHLRNVNFGRDFEGEVVDLREVQEGDGCPRCGRPLRMYRGIEGGHVFVLGTHYSERMGATFLDAEGEQRFLVMGCYGIGISRLVAAAVEQHHDQDGICWPMALAPYQVSLLALGKQPEVLEATEVLYSKLRERGVEVLYDDRAERPGVKFKDADLVGLPLRLAVGGRSLREGVAELRFRKSGAQQKVPLDEAAARVEAAVRDLMDEDAG